jgi:hypothetical protein
MTEKSDFDKIGVNTVKCQKRNDRWVFLKDNVYYDMAPANITDYLLSPIVYGADRLINIGCKLKNIKNPESGFLLLFSENYFPNADVKLEFSENKYDGWTYKVNSLNLQGLLPDQGAWICSYMKFYYEKPPQSLYLKLENIDTEQ